MKRIFFGNQLTPYLLLVCVVLAGIVMLERFNPTQLTIIESRLESDPADTTDASLPRTTHITPDIKTYDEILERPLFLEGRAPPVQPDPVQTRATVKIVPLRLQLEGVAITPEIKVAVVRDLGNKKLLKLEEGMKHQGWVLESVNTTSAIFKHGEQTEELTLVVDKENQGKRLSTYRQSGLPGVAGGRVTLDSIRLKKPASTGGLPAPDGGTTPENGKAGK